MQFLPGNIELSSNPFEKSIWEILKKTLSNKEGILGYKIPALGTKNNDDIPSFILRSSFSAVLIIDVVGDRIVDFDEEGRFWIKEDGDDFLSRDLLISNFKRDVENKLSKSTILFDYKQGVFKHGKLVDGIIIFANNTLAEITKIESVGGKIGISFFTKESFEDKLAVFLAENEREDLDSEIIDEIDSILDGTSIFNKRKKRIELESPTRNDLIKRSLIQTFKLDSIQRSVALQVPNGPQRIRGLAGTGKTIILSMKAALTHKHNREKGFKILFVFNTQSMYKQIIENIEKYTIEESSTSPDWDQLNVLHAWGGKKKEGLYSKLCSDYSLNPKTYYDARGQGDPYQYIYSDFLAKVRTKIVPEYDMVLIDEAQDFPPTFFETIFLITKKPKRIIWAYDEFQSLNELKIAEPNKMFGTNPSTQKPNMPDSVIEGEYEGGIKKDFMLPNSYRNPRKVLMYAHGLGLGLYTERSKVPMEDKFSWEARGYKIIEPVGKIKFEQDDHLIVERPARFSKNILESLIAESEVFKKENIITYAHHDTNELELKYVVEGIVNLVRKDKIEPEEIIVITLDKRNAEEHFKFIRRELNSVDIQCITPGFVEKSDQFKERGRVTLSTPFRAKGNEGNIVFVMNSQHVINDITLQERNALFVSITRSRGWCFVSGSGKDSITLRRETEEIEKFYPTFDFIFPKKSDYQRRLKIISDLDKNLSKAEKQVDEILKQETHLALLLEKAKDDPNLIKKIREMLSDDK